MNDASTLSTALAEAAQTFQDWLLTHVLVEGSLVQLLATLALFGLSWQVAPPLRAALASTPALRKTAEIVSSLALPLVWLVLEGLASQIAKQAGWPNHVLVIVVSLLAAWVAIHILARMIRDPAWSRTLSVIVWVLAALSILDLLGPTADLLDSLSLTVGELRLSVLGVLKGLVLLGGVLWLAGLAARVVESQLGALATLSPTAQVLVGKIMRLLLYTLAVLAVLNSLGIDLTALAVFSGAVGLGIGFGLQKVFSNLISGFILLLDKSVKPGDIIALGDTYGAINRLSARYVSVITGDGTEHLIPNEELISQRVENWSFSSENVRIHIPVGVSYNTDPRRAMALCVEAAEDTPRILSEPKPTCLMSGYGESSVDLELLAWISDPVNGILNVKSALYLSIWDKFKAHNIEIPFPQRDLHIRADQPLPKTMKSAE